MKVVFADEATYVMNDVDPEGVLFVATAEGRSFKCIITRLALSHHCSSVWPPEQHHRHGGREECIARFHANRDKVYAVAQRVIRKSGIASGKVLITSSDFLPDGTRPGLHL